MEQAKMLRPVYKCRLCGEAFGFARAYSKDEAFEDLAGHVFGEPMVCIDTPRLLETHICQGPYAGSVGLADLLGYKVVL